MKTYIDLEQTCANLGLSRECAECVTIGRESGPIDRRLIKLAKRGFVESPIRVSYRAFVSAIAIVHEG